MTYRRLVGGYWDGLMWHYALECGHIAVTWLPPWLYPRGWFCLPCFEAVLRAIREATGGAEQMPALPAPAEAAATPAVGAGR